MKSDWASTVDATLIDGSILALVGRRHVDLGHFLAGAHDLRGTACEAKRLAVRALDDYAMGPVLAPDPAAAPAARDRLHAERRET